MTRKSRIIIIDGNNLAHFLYTNLRTGQKLTQADSLRLIAHLHDYAASLEPGYEVELCLDRYPGEPPPDEANFRIFWAEYPQTGDDLMLGRFWYHQLTQHPNVNVTNDEGMIEEITQAQGSILRVYDFVRRPGVTTPVFRFPEEFIQLFQMPSRPNTLSGALSLNHSIYFRIAHANLNQQSARQRRSGSQSQLFTNQNKNFSPNHTSKSFSANPLIQDQPTEESQTVDTVTPPDRSIPGESEPFSEQNPYYYLTLENWPLVEGFRFLANSFCDQHNAQIQEILKDIEPETIRSADLRALADLLLNTCGDEPDFARRGALMTRVRLALLQAEGNPLSLTELAHQTDLKPIGLRGRIKAKAGKWAGILQL
jgi:hypothetical protein